MTPALYIPPQDEASFASLPADCIADIYARHRAVMACIAVEGRRGVAGEVAALQAKVLGVSLARMRMIVSQFRQQGWRALRNTSRWPDEMAREQLPAAFLKHWHDRCLKRVGGKSLSQIWEKLKADWLEARRLGRDGVFPGYPITPAADLTTLDRVPAGWGKGNLVRRAPSKAELTLAWRGAGAFRAVGPQVLTDRKTLVVGARLQIDDYHWNKHVVFHTGGVPQIVRIHQLGIFDVRSACLPSVFFHPVVERPDGTKDGIKQDHTLLLLCSYLFNHGYIPGETQLALERGTAGLHERHREAFATFAPGLFFDDAGSRERHQPNGWGGKDRTNPNKKAGLESLHHLLTNIEGGLAGDTGTNYTEQAEHVHGMMKEVKWLLSKVQTREQLRLLQLPVLDFDQFRVAAREVIATANSRRNHSLQGFPTVTAFRLNAESEDWFTADEMLALPAPSQLALADAARMNPALFTARVKRAPLDVWNEGRTALTRISAMQACHLAASVMGKGTLSRVVRSRRLSRAFFALSETRLAYLSEPIVFESRILNVRGEWEELPADMDVEIVFNPLDESHPRKCFVRDERGGFMGLAMEAQRINPNDREELLDALAHRAVRTAERTLAVRDTFADDREKVAAMKRHNRAVLGGEPVTAADKQRDRAKRAITREASEALSDYDNNTNTNTNHTDTSNTDEPASSLDAYE